MSVAARKGSSTEKTYEKKAITYELAARMVSAAIEHAKELNAKQNVAVLDESGNLKAFGRMDGAPLLGSESMIASNGAD